MKKSKMPLQELANNPEDCNKLCKAIFGVEWSPPVRGWYSGKSKAFSICAEFKDRYHAEITIHLDGQITQSGMHGKANVFKIVDTVRKLGYDFIQK